MLQTLGKLGMFSLNKVLKAQTEAAELEKALEDAMTARRADADGSKAGAGPSKGKDFFTTFYGGFSSRRPSGR